MALAVRPDSLARGGAHHSREGRSIRARGTASRRRAPVGGNSRRRAEPEEVRSLFRRWQEDRDGGARDELFERYMPLARRIARRYWSAFEAFDDLVQVASLGLMGAIDRFDPERGAAFEAFAVPTILGELKRYFRNSGWSAHVPRTMQELALRVEVAQRELPSRSGRSPQVQELAQYLEIETEEVLAALGAAASRYAVSLETPASSLVEDGESLGESLGAEDQGYDLVEMAMALRVAGRDLTVKERQALQLRLELNLRQTDIAQRLECSQMQVSRLLHSAAAKLAPGAV